MTGVGLAGGAVERARRACRALVRAARAHRLYASNNATLQRLLEELDASFQDLLAHEQQVTLDVRRTTFELDGTAILSEEHLEDSLPYAFYRDGIRRLAFTQGLTREELFSLLEATAQRLNFAGLGEDIVSLLWRLDLDHIDYVVVDTTLASADLAPSPHGTANLSVGHKDARLGGILRALFGDGEDAPLSMHLDAHDVPAKAIADTLGRPDDMAPGLHPTAGLSVEATYAREILEEVAEEGGDAIALRGLEGTLRAFGEPLPESELTALGEALLRMLDTAILESQYPVATRVVHGIRHAPHPRERIAEWMDQVVAEARIRHVGSRYAARLSDEDRSQVVAFFRACGQWAVSPLLRLLPSVSDARNRRSLSELAIELGLFDIDLLRPLLDSEQAFVAQEGVFLLSKLNHEGSIDLLRDLRRHPLPQVRAAVADFAVGLPKDVSADLTADLLDDPDPRVRGFAAKALAKHPSKTTELLLESASQKSRLEGTTLEAKRATLEAYADVAQERAVHPIARYVREGDGLFALREQEELAVASVWALARIRSVTAVEILKRSCTSRNRRLKQSAREALAWMKENM